MAPTNKTKRKNGGADASDVIARQPVTDRTISEAARKRLDAMNACAPIVTQTEIANVLESRSVDVSRASVGHVIHGRFWNGEIAAMFCALTGTELATMWPDFPEQVGTAAGVAP
jgi:hypothetical protein